MAPAPKRGPCRSPWLVAGILYFLFAVAAVLTYSNFSRVSLKQVAKTFSLRRLMARMRGTGRQRRRGSLAEYGQEPYRGAWGWNETESAEAKQYEGTAMITLATGDSAAKHAVVLLQTLRDSGTKIPVLEVLLSKGGLGSEDCHNDTLRNIRNAHYPCSSMHVEERDIVSQQYLDAFRRLGARIRVIDPIEDTPYTARIPGGRNSFWGMSFNKLRIFGYTEYRKILFIDADVLVLRNVDHVLLEPGFTAAFTTECCNRGARAKLGGGMWIFEPSAQLWNTTQELIKRPCPENEDGTWVHADMDVVNYLFCAINEKRAYANWPFVRDTRQGVVPGLEHYPAYRNHKPADMARLVAYPESGLPVPPGLLPQYKEHKNPLDPKGQIWRMLDSRFDGLVGTCECMPERDMPDTGFTVHFSCMNVLTKPGHIHTEQEFLSAVYRKAMGCTRYYFLRWLNAYQRGMDGQRLPPPYYTGPPVPAHNATHDALVEVWRVEDKKAKEEAEKKGQ